MQARLYIGNVHRKTQNLNFENRAENYKIKKWRMGYDKPSSPNSRVERNKKWVLQENI